jgi:hypothetical protein
LIFLYLNNKIYNLYNLIKNNLYNLYFSKTNINNNQMIRIIDSNKNLEKFKIIIYIILEFVFNNCIICLLIFIYNKSFNSEFHIIKICDFNNDS